MMPEYCECDPAEVDKGFDLILNFFFFLFVLLKVVPFIYRILCYIAKDFWFCCCYIFSLVSWDRIVIAGCAFLIMGLIPLVGQLFVRFTHPEKKKRC